MKPTETDNAELVLRHAKASVKHFRDAFSAVRKSRNASGPPTAGEQDRIRASLIFAAAGLDSVVKELIRNSIRSLAVKDLDVQRGLEEYAKRQLKTETDGSQSKNAVNFLATGHLLRSTGHPAVGAQGLQQTARYFLKGNNG